MRKSTLFISAVLTAFILAVLAGVLLSYRAVAGAGTTGNNSSAVQQASSSAADIGSQQAANIAARFIGHNDPVSVDAASLFGSSTYKVTFSNGDIVYVTPQGQVLAYALASSSQAGTSAGFGNSSPGEESGDHD